jgi:hypothetical protein
MLVFSICDSTEVTIRKMIEADERIIRVNQSVQGEGELEGGLDPATKPHLKFQIKTLQNAPRNPDK